MNYLITNRTLKLFLFVGLITLSACSTHPTKPNYTWLPGALFQSEHALALEASITPNKATSQAVWRRLFSLYQLTEVSNARVQAEINWYLKHPDYLQRVQHNAAPYLYFIVNEVEKRGMPGEIALLPIVESAFRPFAYSHGRAAGLWQFIPSTGKYFGLKQNWWYDGRRDVYASTQAALKYLAQSAKRFDGDWLLALSAYNAGGGTISSAIKKNRRLHKATDFWSLDLRKETRHYAPKLLAISYLLAHADEYNISLVEIKDEPYFQRVELKQQIDLARAAQVADISIEQLYQLNPCFNQWATAPNGPHYLLIPKQNAQPFIQAITTLPDDQWIQFVRHKILPGQTLSQISATYHTSRALIQQSNHLSGDSIRAGKYLLIPTPRYQQSLYSSSADQRKKEIINAQRKGKKLVHNVMQGESLWTLAVHYKVSVRALAKWNAMAPGDTLKAGQTLHIWQTNSHTSSVNPRPTLSRTQKEQSIRYTVRAGDSLYLISQKFKVSIADLKRWNTLPNKYLNPGQKLNIIVDITRS